MKKKYTLIACISVFSMVFAAISHGAQRTWVGAQNGVFSDRDNWAPAGELLPEDELIIQNSASAILSGQSSFTAAKLTLNGGTLTINAVPCPEGEDYQSSADYVNLWKHATLFTISGDIVIENKGKLITLCDPVSGSAVRVKCENLSLDQTSSINSDGGGFFWYSSIEDSYAYATMGDYQTRAPGVGYTFQVGGAYGNNGGNSVKEGVLCGHLYGFRYAPFLPGSHNGMYNNSLSNSKPGGGVVWIDVQDTATIDGKITSKQKDNTMYGGSSGGSVWLTTSSVVYGEKAILDASGTMMQFSYGAGVVGSGGRVSLGISLSDEEKDALARGEEPSSLHYQDFISAIPASARAGYNNQLPPVYGRDGTATTVFGQKPSITINKGKSLQGFSPSYGCYTYEPNTTVSFSAPQSAIHVDNPLVATVIEGYVVSNLTSEIARGAGTTFTYTTTDEPVNVTWIEGGDIRISFVEKPQNGTLTLNGVSAVGDLEIGIGDSESVMVGVIPDEGYEFLSWEGNLNAACVMPLTLDGKVNYSVRAILRPAEESMTRTFVGGSEKDWHDAAAWDPQGIPGRNDNLVVNSGTLRVSNHLMVDNLTISGGTVNFAPQGDRSPELDVQGDLVFQGGKLNFGVDKNMVGHGKLDVRGDLLVTGSSTELNLYGGKADSIYTHARGSSVVTVAGLFSVDEGAKVQPYSHYLTGGSVKIVAQNFFLGETAIIDATGKGYMWEAVVENGTTVQKGPDTIGVGNSYTIGASYGGTGEVNSSGKVSTPYGNLLSPVHPGSPSGNYNFAGINRGGGLVRIHANNMTIGGKIFADAAKAYQFGGGSGGGIWLTARILSFGENAVLSAKGGSSNYNSCGGGGRIAITKGATEEQLQTLAETGNYGRFAEKSKTPEEFKEIFGQTITIDLDNFTNHNVKHNVPGTFAFVDAIKRNTLLIVK